MPNQPQYQGASGLPSASNQMFNQGLKTLTGSMDAYADRIRENAKNKSIREVLQATRGKDESTIDFKQGQLNNLLTKNLVSPEEAIMYSNAVSKKYEDQDALDLADVYRTQDLGYKDAQLVQDADKQLSLDKYRDTTTDETKRYHEATEGDFTIIDDEYGKTWQLDKNTGVRTPINTGVYGSNGVPFGGKGGKNIIMVDKTVPDGFGGSTKVKVPVDKRTGKDAEGNVPQVINQAAFSQKDKDWSKNYGQSGTTVGNVRASLGNKGIWGGLDALTGPVGAFFGSKEGSDQRLVKQDLENLRLEATNKLTGVLSNQDMQIILDTIPTINDQPEVARQKLAKVEKSMAQADANQFNRLVKSNPNAVKDMAIGMVNGSTPVPPGYQLVQYDDGSVSLIPK